MFMGSSMAAEPLNQHGRAAFNQEAEQGKTGKQE